MSYPQGGYGSQGGYPPQGGYGPQGGYPPQGGYGPQGGYPPQQGGYPPQQGGYPPQQGGYQQGPGDDKLPSQGEMRQFANYLLSNPQAFAARVDQYWQQNAQGGIIHPQAAAESVNYTLGIMGIQPLDPNYIISVMDQNHDGRIERHEFEGYMRRIYGEVMKNYR